MGRAARPRLSSFSRPSHIVMFATCAAVNTFQAPATIGYPMLEEFYLIDSAETTVHFRYGGKALAIPFIEGYSTSALVRRIRARD